VIPLQAAEEFDSQVIALGNCAIKVKGADHSTGHQSHPEKVAIGAMIACVLVHKIAEGKDDEKSDRSSTGEQQNLPTGCGVVSEFSVYKAQNQFSNGLLPTNRLGKRSREKAPCVCSVYRVSQASNSGPDFRSIRTFKPCNGWRTTAPGQNTEVGTTNNVAGNRISLER